MKPLTSLLVIGLAASGWAQAPAEDSLQTGVKVSQLKDHIYIITCTGGSEFNLPLFESRTVASVGPDGILLVDDGFTSTAEDLRDSLKTLADGRLISVINTHYHGDHAFANHVLKSEAAIISHRSAIDALSGRYFNLEGAPNRNQPTVGFGDSLLIAFNGEKISVVHAPECHTAGDAYVYFPDAKIVAVGDLFFPDEIPYVDLGGGGTVAGYQEQIKRFIEDFPDDITFIAAHGRSYNKDDLREYDRMLAGTVGAVHSAISEGKTLQEMFQGNILSEWADWKGSFATTTLEAWIQTVYVETTTPPGSWKPSICEPLTEILVSGTADDAVKRYHELKQTRPDDYDFDEAHLNMLGYQLFMRNRVNEAALILALNVEAYPNSFNVYDSYGEALMLLGDTAQAIINYEKSLELNPDNTNATEMLKRLR